MKLILTTCFCSIFMLGIGIKPVKAQQSLRKVRIAKIEVFPDSLEAYKRALAEHAATAVKVEPGVLALEAVYEKGHPSRVTVFEVYASEAAYQLHLKTPHFQKYKTGTSKMVKSLELIEVEPIAMEIKPELVTGTPPHSTAAHF